MPQSNHWHHQVLGEIADLLIGGTPSRSNKNYWAESDSSGFPWCSIRDLNQKYISKTKEKITQNGVSASNVKRIPSGTLIASFKLSIGRLAFTKIDLFTNEAIVAIIPKNEAVNERFLYHCLPAALQNTVAETAVKGATLNLSKLKKISFFSPERICEQGVIADILDAIDDAIIETDALIAKHEQVKLGMLDNLVAAPAQIADRQAPHTLADLIGSISSGCSVNADDRPPTAGEYGVLKTSAVSNGRFRLMESKAVWPREVNRLKCPVTAGLILFSRMNTPQLVGENAYVEEDHPGLFLPDRLWAIRVKDDPEILPQWVAAILQTRQARAFITGEATGTSGSMKNIARTSLLRMRLRQLPESDQRRAVEAIGAAQLQLDVLRTERDKLAALRNGLRDDLLTGRVSVKALVDT